jgi:hypothetical protein
LPGHPVFTAAFFEKITCHSGNLAVAIAKADYPEFMPKSLFLGKNSGSALRFARNDEFPYDVMLRLARASGFFLTTDEHGLTRINKKPRCPSFFLVYLPPCVPIKASDAGIDHWLMI